MAICNVGGLVPVISADKQKAVITTTRSKLIETAKRIVKLQSEQNYDRAMGVIK